MIYCCFCCYYLYFLHLLMIHFNFPSQSVTLCEGFWHASNILDLSNVVKSYLHQFHLRVIVESATFSSRLSSIQPHEKFEFVVPLSLTLTHRNYSKESFAKVKIVNSNGTNLLKELRNHPVDYFRYFHLSMMMTTTKMIMNYLRSILFTLQSLLVSICLHQSEVFVLYCSS